MSDVHDIPELILPPAPVATWGALGRMAENPLRRLTCRLASELVEIMPRPEWPELIKSFGSTLSERVWHIFNQGSRGSCNAQAATQVLQIFRECMGLPRVVLSPGWVYSNISPYPADRGSAIGDGLHFVSVDGVPSADVVEEQYFGRPSRENPEGTNELYRVAEWLELDGDNWFDLAVSGVLSGLPGVLGVNWPGGGGHAVCFTEVIMGVGRRGNVWYGLRGPNSWGAEWNGDGFWELQESQLGSVPGYGCWLATEAVYA